MSTSPKVIPVTKVSGRGCVRYVMVDNVIRVKASIPWPQVLIRSGLKGRPIWMTARLTLAELNRRLASRTPPP